jgi:hypothetical protein
LREALRPFGLAPTTLDRLFAWPGALASEEGVPDSTREALRAARCIALVHSAGLTRFDAHLAASLHHHNVLGTQAAVARVSNAAASLPWKIGLANSIYQSQKSSQKK